MNPPPPLYLIGTFAPHWTTTISRPAPYLSIYSLIKTLYINIYPPLYYLILNYLINPHTVTITRVIRYIPSASIPSNQSPITDHPSFHPYYPRTDHYDILPDIHYLLTSRTVLPLPPSYGSVP